jgi:DNA-binding IclR family transcriptional regulator
VLGHKILRLLQQAGPEGLPPGEIYRRAHTDKAHTTPALETLLKEGQIIQIPVPSRKRGGRRGKRYVAVEAERKG